MSQCLTHNSIRAGTVDDNFTFLDNSGNSNPVTWPPTHPPTPANMSTHFDDGTPASNLWEAKATVFAESHQQGLEKQQPAPNPNSGNQIHLMFQPCKLRTFNLQCKLNFRDRKDMFEDDTEKVNYCPLLSEKGTASRLFWICHPGSHRTPMAFRFRPIRWRTRSQLWNLQSSRRSRSRTRRTSDCTTVIKPQSTLSSPAASRMHSVGWWQHSVVRLTMDSPNVSKMIWSTMKSWTPSLDSGKLVQGYRCRYWNEKENSPAKPELPDLLETSPNTSPAKVLPTPSRRTTTPALPRARAQLPNRRSPPLPTFLLNSGKTES